jgi:hypothetical protein
VAAFQPGVHLPRAAAALAVRGSGRCTAQSSPELHLRRAAAPPSRQPAAASTLLLAGLGAALVCLAQFLVLHSLSLLGDIVLGAGLLALADALLFALLFVLVRHVRTSLWRADALPPRH